MVHADHHPRLRQVAPKAGQGEVAEMDVQVPLDQRVLGDGEGVAQDGLGFCDAPRTEQGRTQQGPSG